MEARIVLSSEEGSALFSERVLTLRDGGHVTVARAAGDDCPAGDNAVFDSKVLIGTLSLLILILFYLLPVFCLSSFFLTQTPSK